MNMKQAAQVLDLLEFFKNRSRPATMAEICKELGWPKSSTFKLLGVLASRGYLYEPYSRGMYYPSPKWTNVIDAIARSEPVPAELSDILQSLVQETKETAVLASISGQNALFMDAFESPNSVRYTAQIGKLVPLYATAVGRALLAQLPQGERSSMLSKIDFKKFTAETLVTVSEVEAEIVEGLQRGYFEGKGELNEDLGGIAIPLFSPGRPFAVMVAGPLYRIGPRYIEIAQLTQERIRKVDWGPA